jgi:hypothetical protein
VCGLAVDMRHLFTPPCEQTSILGSDYTNGSNFDVTRRSNCSEISVCLISSGQFWRGAREGRERRDLAANS